MRHKVGTHISAPTIQSRPDYERPVRWRPPAWTELANCVGLDTNIFYQENRFWRAKQICRACLVKADCLASAPDNQYGVFGGTTPAERKAAQRP